MLFFRTLGQKFKTKWPRVSYGRISRQNKLSFTMLPAAEPSKNFSSLVGSFKKEFHTYKESNEHKFSSLFKTKTMIRNRTHQICNTVV